MQKNILIIDDDEDDRTLFIDAVKEVDNAGTCLGAESGIEALTLLKSGIILPDLIFLDLNMPRLSGKEFLVLIKDDPLLLHIPVIIYSTSQRQEDMSETKKLGAAGFLTKPVFFNEICRSVVDILQAEWK